MLLAHENIFDILHKILFLRRVFAPAFSSIEHVDRYGSIIISSGNAAILNYYMCDIFISQNDLLFLWIKTPRFSDRGCSFYVRYSSARVNRGHDARGQIAFAVRHKRAFP